MLDLSTLIRGLSSEGKTIEAARYARQGRLVPDWIIDFRDRSQRRRHERDLEEKRTERDRELSGSSREGEGKEGSEDDPRLTNKFVPRCGVSRSLRLRFRGIRPPCI